MKFFHDHKFEEPRLIWKKLGEGPRNEPKGRSAGEEKERYDARVQAGSEPTTRPPESRKEILDRNQSIDPGTVNDIHLEQEDLKNRLPQLRQIIEELETIEFEEFDKKFSAFKQEKNQIIEIAGQMKEALLFKAIVENWSREALIDEYRRVMKDLFTECADRPWLQKGWGQIQRAWHEVYKREDLSISKTSPHEHLNDRQLKVTDRLGLNRKLLEIENTYRKLDMGNDIDICLTMKLDGSRCSDWEDSDDLNEDHLKFVQETAIPFYRSFVINRGIVENTSQEELEREYRKILNTLYQQCQIPGEW